MPRVKLSKWYGVRKGREGARVYETWTECEQMVGPLRRLGWPCIDECMIFGVV